MSKAHPLKAGDQVVMHTCDEANYADYYGRIWTCESDEWSVYGEDFVLLDGWNSPFQTKYLQKVRI